MYWRLFHFLLQCVRLFCCVEEAGINEMNKINETKIKPTRAATTRCDPMWWVLKKQMRAHQHMLLSCIQQFAASPLLTTCLAVGISSCCMGERERKIRFEIFQSKLAKTQKHNKRIKITTIIKKQQQKMRRNPNNKRNNKANKNKTDTKDNCNNIFVVLARSQPR